MLAATCAQKLFTRTKIAIAEPIKITDPVALLAGLLGPFAKIPLTLKNINVLIL